MVELGYGFSNKDEFSGVNVLKKDCEGVRYFV